MIVGFQGEPGAYSEIAASRIGEPRGFRTFHDVFQAIINGEVACGALPVENSLGGSIHENYDLLLKYHVEIVAETFVRIEHCLMGLPGASLGSAKQVLSHPQALAQCDKFLQEHPELEAVAAYDTAGSAKMIRESGEREKLAIASERAAEVYKLEIIEHHISTMPDNFTRFAIVATKPADKKSLGVPAEVIKTSIVFSLPHQKGTLFHALSVFALREINLTKIESRPLREKPFEYLFYIDYQETKDAQRSKRALNHLNEVASFLKVLGSYGRIGEEIGGR
jgi:prephenate dehydratase